MNENNGLYVQFDLIYFDFFHFCKRYYENFRRAMHVIQALNGNKCNAYFVSGEIKELKKRIFEREVYILSSA